VRIDPRYFRPAEVESLLGDATQAREKLGWVPEITAQQMCQGNGRQRPGAGTANALLRNHGYSVNVGTE
jgi:GDPmannose 4,6-dehydratase